MRKGAPAEMRHPAIGRLLVLLVALAALIMFVVVAVGMPSTKADTAPRGPGERPPKAVLMKGEKELQKGRLGSYCWPLPEGVTCADTFDIFPDPRTTAHVGAGSTLHIRIHYGERPQSVELRGHTVNQRGQIVATSRPKATSLRPVLQDGETIAWDAFFTLNRPERHYYLTLWAFWEDRDAQWGFHVKTRRGS